MVVFILSYLDWKYPFGANLAQKIKILDYFEYVKFDDDDQFFLF